MSGRGRHVRGRVRLPDGREYERNNSIGLFDSSSELATLRTRLAELNLGNISEMSLRELDFAVGEALDVTPSIDDPTDLKASEAWILANFAFFDCSLVHQRARGLTIEYAIMIGRLIQWWVWRLEGHAEAAVRGKRFMGKSTKRANQQRRRDAEGRRRALINQARKYLEIGQGRFATGKINFSKLAEVCLSQSEVKLNIAKARARNLLRKAADLGEL